MADSRIGPAQRGSDNLDSSGSRSPRRSPIPLDGRPGRAAADGNRSRTCDAGRFGCGRYAQSGRINAGAKPKLNA